MASIFLLSYEQTAFVSPGNVRENDNNKKNLIKKRFKTYQGSKPNICLL